MSLNRKQRRTAKAVSLPVSSPPSPRAASDIQAEYGKLCAQLGEVTYQAQVYENTANRIKNSISTLNDEMGKRMELDRVANNVPSLPEKK